MKHIPLRLLLLSFLFTSSLRAVHAQDNAQLDGRQNVITTAVPFLTIAPDARSGALGDAGVAISPDANTIHWNPAKLAFQPKQTGFGLSYTPWLSQLVNDISLSYLSGFTRIDKLSAFGGSLRYFSLGDITFRDQTGTVTGQGRPYEMALDGAYARKLSDNFSVGVALRFIYSDLASAAPPTASGASSEPGIAGAGDISAFYTQEQNFFGKDGRLNFGMNISNIGNKINYGNTAQSDFIPTNFRLGAGSTINIDEYNQITLSFDLNKLMVPTPDTLAGAASASGIVLDTSGSDKSVIEGMFSSFGDAPGGFEEELREISPSVGIEYLYNQQFALRTGYFYEHETKGNRKYLTFGVGVNWKVVDLNFSYLVPTIGGTATSPLANTLRFSAIVSFDNFKDDTKQEEPGNNSQEIRVN